MKVKLLVSRAGVGFVQNRGDEIEVSDDEGARMIEASQAIEIIGLKKETASSKTKTEKAAE